MGKKAKDIPHITHAHLCLECVRHEVACVGPELGTCVERKRTKLKCDKSRGKGKATSDEKGKAPGKSFHCLFSFLDESASATEVHAVKRQKDPSLFELSDLNDVEMESPVAQGTRKAPPHQAQKAKSRAEPPHATGFCRVHANIRTLQACIATMDSQLDELMEDVQALEASLQ
jgi:hypothetical protein